MAAAAAGAIKVMAAAYTIRSAELSVLRLGEIDYT
jgi:hypothetical protein